MATIESKIHGAKMIDVWMLTVAEAANLQEALDRDDGRDWELIGRAAKRQRGDAVRFCTTGRASIELARLLDATGATIDSRG